MITVPSPDSDDLLDAAYRALLDAGVTSQAGARTTLAGWCRFARLAAPDQAGLVARFPFIASCDFGGIDQHPPGARRPGTGPPVNALTFPVPPSPPVPDPGR